MRTIRIHLAAVFGLALAPAVALAQDAPTDPAPAEPAVAPAAAEPAAVEAAPVPAATEPPGNPAAAGATVAAAPEDTGTTSTEVASDETPSAIINVDVEGASAYVWRGVNLFGETQNTQNFSVFPSLTATFGALSIGYWGAFQMTGDNKTQKLDGGVGAEQDFILKYVDSIAEGVGYTAMLTYWIYPFADEVAAGTATPMYIEPLLGVTYASALDLGLNLSYYRGLQDATKVGSFFYINPSIGKTLPLSGDVSLALGLSGGYKAYTDLADEVDPDYAFDLTLNAGVTLPFSDMYITPQAHAAFVTRSDDAVNDEAFIAWAGVHVGYNIGL
jgi:hypothetical protein